MAGNPNADWPDARRWRPRTYQEPAAGALASGSYRHVVTVWNRRAGKDKTALNLTIEKMQERVGNYVHVFPTLADGRLNLWEQIDRTGFPALDHFPAELVAGKRDDIMRIRLKNGSTWRVGGANNPDSWRGGNPVGIVWSEYALMKPSVRLIADPILRENGGWEWYAYTPKGANHGRTLYEMAIKSPDWFCDLLTVHDTRVIDLGELDRMRAEGVPEEWIQQEWFCSFAAPMVGSYYGAAIERLERAGMVGHFPWIPELPVDITWDLGIGADDATAIWFIQTLAGGWRVIDYYETNKEGLPEIVRMLQDKPYVYGRTFFPHDVERRVLSEEQSARSEKAGTRVAVFLRLMPQFRERGRLVINRILHPKTHVAERIDATRRMLPHCQFNDVPAVQEGLDALKSYRREADEKRAKDTAQPFFKDHPLHDWASHAADSLGHFAVSTPDVPKRAAETYDEVMGVPIPATRARRGRGREAFTGGGFMG